MTTLVEKLAELNNSLSYKNIVFKNGYSSEEKFKMKKAQLLVGIYLLCFVFTLLIKLVASGFSLPFFVIAALIAFIPSLTFGLIFRHWLIKIDTRIYEGIIKQRPKTRNERKEALQQIQSEMLSIHLKKCNIDNDIVAYTAIKTNIENKSNVKPPIQPSTIYLLSIAISLILPTIFDNNFTTAVVIGGSLICVGIIIDLIYNLLLISRKNKYANILSAINYLIDKKITIQQP